MSTSGPGRTATTDSWRALVLDMFQGLGIEERLSRDSAVVVERLARGGGITAWYRLEAPSDLSKLIRELRPGSDVRFAFGEAFAQGEFDDGMARRVQAIAARDGDAVILADGANFELEHDFPSSVGDAREFVAGQPSGHRVFVGAFPGDNQIILPDADGVVRAHPH